MNDTEESLKFYRNVLGLQIAGESENYGPEQEYLNNIFGARLRITSLRAAAGPGIELLEYLTPRDGRPMPAEEKANDLTHWQTRLVTSSAEGAFQQLHARTYAFVSSGVIALSEPQLDFKKAVLIRDPDGHVMEIIEK